MKTPKKNCRTIDVVVIAVIIAVAIGVALLINMLLSHDIAVIPTIFSKSEWFGFWTTYSTGVFAVIIGYLSITAANRNSNRAIWQQNGIIVKQESDGVYREIVNEVREHNKLFNIIRLTSSILSYDEKDIVKARTAAYETKAKIHEMSLNWSVIKTLYLSGEFVAPIVSKYDSKFSSLLEELDRFAKSELDLLNALDSTIKIEHPICILKQLIQVNESKHNRTEEDARLLQQYKTELEEKLAEEARAHGEIKKHVEIIRLKIHELQSKQDDFFRESMIFISELNRFTFVSTGSFTENCAQKSN